MGYWTYGRHVPSYVVDVIPNGPLRRIANVFMLLHTMVSYILMSQVLCSALVKLVHPIKRSLSDPGLTSGTGQNNDTVSRLGQHTATTVYFQMLMEESLRYVPVLHKIFDCTGSLMHANVPPIHGSTYPSQDLFSLNSLRCVTPGITIVKIVVCWTVGLHVSKHARVVCLTS